jgi:hypothetical protein
MAIANITGNILTDTGVAISSLVSGTGTTNYLSKFTGTSTLGNSLIFDNGTSLFIGNGQSSATPQVGIIEGTDGSGTNIAGAEFRIQGGQGTGTGVGGAVTFYTAPAGSTGSSLNTAVERMRITSAGNVGIGTGSPSYQLSLNAATPQLGLSSTSANGYAEIYFSRNTSTAIAYLAAGINSTVSASGDEFVMQNMINGGNLIFRTNSGSTTEKMRITSSGSVGIGVIPKNYASTWVGFQAGNFSLMGPNPASDQNAILGANAYRASDNSWKRIIGGYGNVIEFNQGSGDIRFYTGGTGSADSTISLVSGPFLVNGGASWTNGSSDIRKKKNFEPSQGLAEVLQIEAVKYHFNWDDDNSIKRLGFKAQNLQTIIPEMVMETGEIAEDGTSYLTITPDYILPVLVKAIQELSAKVSALENKS